MVATIENLATNEQTPPASELPRHGLRDDIKSRGHHDPFLATSALADVTGSTNKPLLMKMQPTNFMSMQELDAENAETGADLDLTAKLALVRQTMARIHSANGTGDSGNHGEEMPPLTMISSTPSSPSDSSRMKEKTSYDYTSSGTAMTEESRDGDPPVGRDHLRGHAAFLLGNARRLLEEPRESACERGSAKTSKSNECPLRNRAQSLLDESRVIRHSAKSKRESKAPFEVETSPPIPVCPIRDHARRLLENTSTPRLSAPSSSSGDESDVPSEEVIQAREEDEYNGVPADIIRTQALRLLEKMSNNLKEESSTNQVHIDDQGQEIVISTNSTPISKSAKGFWAFLTFVLALFRTLIHAAIRPMLCGSDICSLLSTTCSECSKIFAFNPERAASSDHSPPSQQLDDPKKYL